MAFMSGTRTWTTQNNIKEEDEHTHSTKIRWNKEEKEQVWFDDSNERKDKME